MNDLFKYKQPLGKRVLTHIIFWVLYILFFVFQFSFFSKETNYFTTICSLTITAVVDISAAYFTVYFLLPKFLFTKRYFYFIVIFIISAGLAIIAQRVVLYYISYPLLYPDYASGSKPFWHINPFYSFVNIYTVVGFFASIKLLKYWYHNQKLKSELENKNKTSELALLKSQVNPHFLFNTLNNIDSLVAIDQEKASDAIIKLSDIMRYMLYDTATDKVMLEKEINYLQSYIALQGLRFQHSGIVEFNISGSCSNFHIAPMLFISFVENAFKHGKKSGKGAIVINLVCAKEKLVFTVSNKFDISILQQKDKTKGIGLSNVKRRLDLLYPDKYVLDINKEDGEYAVKLQIAMV